jgi:hypothetical protein
MSGCEFVALPTLPLAPTTSAVPEIILLLKVRLLPCRAVAVHNAGDVLESQFEVSLGRSQDRQSPIGATVPVTRMVVEFNAGAAAAPRRGSGLSA